MSLSITMDEHSRVDQPKTKGSEQRVSDIVSRLCKDGRAVKRHDVDSAELPCVNLIKSD